MSDTDKQRLFDSEEVTFLTIEQVIELHDDLVARFSPSESRNILNHGMLDSAVMTPQQSFDGQYIYDTLEKKAAAYIAGLAANHAFENGNKRIALTAGSVFLRLNGYLLTLSQDEAEALILDLVTHKIDREQAAEIIVRAIELL